MPWIAIEVPSSMIPISIYNSLTRDTAMAVELESLSIMMENEQTHYYYMKSDYLSLNYSTVIDDNDAGRITESDRLKIVDWYYSLIDHCQFNRETVAIAMELTDRYLSQASSSASICRALQDRNHFQLVVMTCLYIAIKTNEKLASEYVIAYA